MKDEASEKFSYEIAKEANFPNSEKVETSGGVETSGIEQALKIVEQFSKPNESQSIPTLEHFEMQGEMLKVQNRSTLEKTIAFTKDCLVRTFSQAKRKKQDIQRTAIKGTLLRSVDMIKIYSSALTQQIQEPTVLEKSLAERILACAVRYNAMVRQVKDKPKSISQKIKHFFLSVAGWSIDEELAESEIPLPSLLQKETSSKKSHESIHSHKFTFHIRDSTTRKIASIIQSAHVVSDYEKALPKIAELDAFRLKGLTLLSQQTLVPFASMKELLGLLHETPIESTLLEPTAQEEAIDPLICLKQKIFLFPGEEIEIRGTFQRDPLIPNVTIPIKKSFETKARISQSGFPDPLQYIGLSFSEKLIHSNHVILIELPEYEVFIKDKESLAKALLPGGALNTKAKKLLSQRKDLYKKEQKLLLEHAKNLLLTIVTSDSYLHEHKARQEVITKLFTMLAYSQNGFIQLAHIHRRIIDYFMTKPLEQMESRWLFTKEQKDSEITPEQVSFDFQALLHQKITKMEHTLAESPKEVRGDAEWQIKSYELILAKTFIHALPSIFLLALSKHLHFTPPNPHSFERKLLTCALRQQYAFSYELQDEKFHENSSLLLESILQSFQDEIGIYQEVRTLSEATTSESTKKAKRLVEALLEYYATSSKRSSKSKSHL